MNLLAYVHLRNIHGSTGAGRTARQIVEHLAVRPGVDLRVLADAADAKRVLPFVGEPWASLPRYNFLRDTSAQQLRWFLWNRPPAESFWPEVELMFCTAESYVPVRKARLAVTAHDASYFDDGAHRQNAAFWRTRVKWGLLFSKLAAKADLFHTVSAFSAERLAHAFPAIKSRIRWVHNGVTPHFFDPVPEAGHEYLRSAGLSGCRYVLVPGGLHFRKNAELILQAAPELLRRFPDLVIAVVNHTNPAYHAQAEALGPAFRLLGFVSEEALHALYAAAAVVWFPSRYEGFGLPVVEAMACGAPVVASNSSSIPEIAGSAAMLADPDDASAHVNSLTSLLTDDRARQQLTAAGRARARQFTWSATAEKLNDHFRALL